jgi:uncharacterized protein YjbJ (UPF0337 family)
MMERAAAHNHEQVRQFLREDTGRLPLRWYSGDHPNKEADMNRDTLKGQWMQLKGKVRQQWGKLTDDDLEKIQGNAEMLAGKIQEYYGKTREQAEKELDRWIEQQ